MGSLGHLIGASLGREVNPARFWVHDELIRFMVDGKDHGGLRGAYGSTELLL